MSFGESDSFPSGYMTWLQLRANGRFHFPSTANPGAGDGLTTAGGNMAIKGQAPAGMAARKGVIASAIGSGVLIIGGIENDPWGAWPYHLEVIQACIDGGCRAAFIVPAAPTKSYLANPAPFEAYDAAAASWASANSSSARPITVLSQTWNGLTLANGPTSAGPHSYDIPGVHQNPLGSALQATNMWSQMAPYYQEGDAYSALVPHIGSNALGGFTDLTGAGGTGGGAIADGFSVINGSGATFTNSKGTLDGHASQVITISGSAGSNGTCSFRRNGNAIDVAPGDSIGGVVHLKVSNAAQNGPAIGLRNLSPSTYYDKSRWGSRNYDPLAHGLLEQQAAWFEGIVRFRPVDIGQITAAQSSLNFDTYFTLLTDAQLTTAGLGPLDVRIEIARPMLYNWTTLGVE